MISHVLGGDPFTTDQQVGGSSLNPEQYQNPYKIASVEHAATEAPTKTASTVTVLGVHLHQCPDSSQAAPFADSHGW